MICLSRDFNHLSAFSITNLSKQITFTPFVFISSHVLCFVLHLFNYVYLQKGCHSSAMWGFLLWFLSPLCDTLLHVQLFEGQCQTWDFFPISFAALSVPSAATDPDDEDEDEFDDSDESAEADDDSRIYKNPRNSPSSDCPRDEEQATLLGQKCLRKCSSHEDCKSKKKKCLCDGACGMSCIKPGSSVESKKYDFISGSWAIVFNLFNEIISDRECPELPQPELGSVNMTAREFGGTAIYTCPIGYNVIGVNFSASYFLI